MAEEIDIDRLVCIVVGVQLRAELGDRPLAYRIEGELRTRHTVGGEPRGVFCGMGVCFDCLVVVDGVPNTRACTTWVRDGMQVARQEGLQ